MYGCSANNGMGSIIPPHNPARRLAFTLPHPHVGVGKSGYSPLILRIGATHTTVAKSLQRCPSK